MKSLMRDIPDEWGILKLQNCILNIAAYIDFFCKKHNIEYCLMGGSALGAIRHKGFIPWDDDLDIFMTPENYDKFRKEWYSTGDKNNFYLQQFGNKGKKDGLVSMAKLRMNNSYLIEDNIKERRIHQGVYVDIFILHSCPDNIFKRNWQYFWSKYIIAKDLSHKNYMRHGRLLNLALKIFTFTPRRFLIDFALRQIYKYKNNKTEYKCHFLGRAWMKNALYKSSYFSSTKEVPFETITLKVPIKCEEYLKERWGDYMKLPSKKEIAYFQHSHDWCVDQPFEGYNERQEYPDEKNLIV